MHIKSYYAAMKKYHLRIYPELQNLKAAKKGFIQDYCEKSNLPFQIFRISHLQSSNTPNTAVPRVRLQKMTPTYLKFYPLDLHQI